MDTRQKGRWTVEEVRDLAMRHNHRPNRVFERFHDGQINNVELMSWPFPTEDGADVHVMARLAVGDPTSLTEIDVMELGDFRYTT